MAIDGLTSSSINQFVASYKAQLTKQRIDPLTTQKKRYEGMNSAWGSLKTKLESFKSFLYDLQKTGSDSVFATKKAESSDSKFVTATADKTASPSGYTMRVDQLAKSDSILTNTLASDTAVGSMAGTHTIQVTSGAYTGKVDVALTGSETNKSVYEAISNAINTDKGIVTSASVDGTSTFTGSGSFVIDLNGTSNTINYDFSSGATYSSVMDTLVSSINTAVGGVTAEKVTSGNNVSLKLTVKNNNHYISMEKANDTGSLLGPANLDINVSKEKSVAGLVTASVFSPTTGKSKLSLTAKETGYDNRLILSDVSGSALSFGGLSGALLSARTLSPDNDTAGFLYTANSSTDNQLNSKLTFNGLNIQRNSNSITDLATGVTFNLKSVMAVTDTSTSVTVKNDTDTVKGKVKEFITKFNDVYTFIKNRSTSDKISRGIFVGEATAQSVLRTFSNLAITNVSGIGGGDFDNFSDVGITFDPTVGLAIGDDAKLTAALEEKPTQVASLFNSSSGYASTLYSKVSALTGSDGTLSKLTNGLGRNITYITDRMTATQSSIDKSSDVLRNQYEKLQMQLATLLTNSQFFGSSSGY